MSNEPDWLEELYAQGGEEQPPAALDDRIRAAARQPLRRRWYSSPARLATLATAASLVIAASVIYFDPDQPRQSEAPEDRAADAAVEETLDETAPGSGRANAFKAEPAGPAGEMKQTDSPDQGPGKKVRQMEKPLPAAAGMEADAVQSPPAIGTSTAARSLQYHELAEQEAPISGLEDRCGPLPGTQESRRLHFDGAQWLVIVRIGDDDRTWRCLDGAWIETDSEEQ